MNPGRQASRRIRPPAVAGSFYPDDSDRLAATVDAHLDDAHGADAPNPTGQLKALIVPHAGYAYSGATAAAAYRLLRPLAGTVQRVVLCGPAHHVAVRSMALPSADVLRTPLGDVPVDAAARDIALRAPGVVLDDAAHAAEHSIEVQLPFLQRALDGRWVVLPVAVGGATDDEVADLLRALWGGPETVLIVSTDLSHFHDRSTAEALDRATTEAIVRCDPRAIGSQDACGAHPLRGLLVELRRRRLSPVLLDRRTSADAGGDSQRVVGYGAFSVTSSPSDSDRGRAAADLALTPAELTPADASQLHGAASAAVVSQFTHGTLVLPTGDDVLRRLRRHGASFVTLRDDRGRLAGCVGTMTPTRPLIEDVAANAHAAAFADPRLPVLRRRDLARTVISITVLSSLEALEARSVLALAERLRPGRDGLLVEAGSRRGTFLPAVWTHFADPVEFCNQLWDKAGLPRGSFPGALRAWRYQAVEVHTGALLSPTVDVTDTDADAALSGAPPRW